MVKRAFSGWMITNSFASYCSYPLDTLAGKRVGCFSYGSGVASSFFSARLVPSDSLSQLVDSFKDLFVRLDQRRKMSPEEYDQILKHKEDQYNLGKFGDIADHYSSYECSLGFSSL